ncbi:MAG: DUF4288 domain-containing protein [Nitrososphaera sp.]|nr:DUF4288 domain-containing protein [Nitrososphaera sp.]
MIIYREDLQKSRKWYLSHEILYLEPEDTSCDSKILVWKNLILIRADSPEEAYQKAIQHGVDSENEVRVEGQKGHFKFKGLKDLVLIYDDLDDGAEIEWHEMNLGKEELEKLPKKLSQNSK